jgi:restriction endonuclease Mrr
MLTKIERIAIMKRAHADKEFRTELLKELLRLAVSADPELLERAVARVEKRSKK